MQKDPRLDEIDDCLYRVAVRVLIVHDNKVLLVQEFPQLWWAFPGGGIDHGETVEATLPREVEEELGIPAEKVSSDYKLAFYEFGGIVSGIPRLNLFLMHQYPYQSSKGQMRLPNGNGSLRTSFLH